MPSSVGHANNNKVLLFGKNSFPEHNRIPIAMRSASAGLVSCLLRQRGSRGGGHRQALVSHQPKRDLNLLEYQAKGLLQKYNVTVQDFRVAETAEEAAKITQAFPCNEYVIKAQARF